MYCTAEVYDENTAASQSTAVPKVNRYFHGTKREMNDLLYHLKDVRASGLKTD